MLAKDWRLTSAVSSVISILAKTGRRPTAVVSILCQPTLSMTGRLLFGVHVVRVNIFASLLFQLLSVVNAVDVVHLTISCTGTECQWMNVISHLCFTTYHIGWVLAPE